MDATSIIREDTQRIEEAAGAELERLGGQAVLITGGGGFLGYTFTSAVLHWNASNPDRRIRLTLVDSFIRGVPGWLRDVGNEPGLRIVKHDVTVPLPQDVEEPAYVIHAASIASPTFYRRFPIETMDANVGGLRRLLDRAAAATGATLRGFLFLSSSEIYGDPPADQIPTPETYRGNVSCTGPRACYDESKRFGETLCVNFAARHGLPVRIARPFNNYGPGLSLDDRRVVADLAADVLEGRNITLYSDGRATRTFCYVADAIVGYLKVLTRGRDGEAYNIGAESPEVSIAELADRTADAARALFGYRGRVVRQRSVDLEYLTDNPARRCPSVEKARRELGFETTTTLEDGLRRTLIWYRGMRAAISPTEGILA